MSKERWEQIQLVNNELTIRYLSRIDVASTIFKECKRGRPIHDDDVILPSEPLNFIAEATLIVDDVNGRCRW
jgi:hypothetical protein